MYEDDRIIIILNDAINKTKNERKPYKHMHGLKKNIHLESNILKE